MNVLLWTLQAVLALFFSAGGAYKLFMSDQLASQMAALPRAGWAVIGLFELAGGLLLIVPGSGRWRKDLPPIAAAALAVESVALSAFYASYSTAFTAANPLVWSLVLGVLVAFVAYGRYAIRPAALVL